MRRKSLYITAKTTPFCVAECVSAPDIENVTSLKLLRNQSEDYDQKNMTSYLLPRESQKKETTDIKYELEKNISDIEETSDNLSYGAEALYTEIQSHIEKPKK